MSKSRQWTSYRQLLRNRDFRFLWIGQWFSELGDRVYYVALVLFVYRMAGSAFDVGKVLTIAALPSLLLGPMAGVLVDRWNRKKVMIIADVIRGAAVCLIPLTHSLWQVYCIAFSISTVSIFFTPALYSALPTLIGKGDLLLANTLRSTTRRIAHIAGPVMGGALVASLGPSVGFVADGASFFLAAAAMILVRIPTIPVSQNKEEESYWNQFRAGLSHIRRSVTVLPLIAITILVGFAAGVNNALLIPYAESVLGATGARLGLLISILGVGTFLGVVLLSFGSGVIARRTLMQGALTLQALAYFVFASVPRFLVSLVSRTFIGTGGTCYRIAAQTVIQETVPDRMRGRVFSVYYAVDNSSSLVAMALAGLLADRIGMRPSLLITAFILSLAALLGFALLRGNWRLSSTTTE